MKHVIIDTYAFLAAATNTLSPKAKGVLLQIKKGFLSGVIHGLIIYEVVYHWHKGRLPGFASTNELLDSMEKIFRVAKLTSNIFAEAAKIKGMGDELLRKSEDTTLRGRSLSACDAVSIALAARHGYPILSGDRDLSYVARKMQVEILW